MQIQREVVAQSTKLEELQETLKTKAEELGLGEPRDRNDHGAVYITPHFDLRIERDPGQWGGFRIMLLHKQQQVKPSFRDKFRRG